METMPVITWECNEDFPVKWKCTNIYIILIICYILCCVLILFIITKWVTILPTLKQSNRNKNEFLSLCTVIVGWDLSIFNRFKIFWVEELLIQSNIKMTQEQNHLQKNQVTQNGYRNKKQLKLLFQLYIFIS